MTGSASAPVLHQGDRALVGRAVREAGSRFMRAVKTLFEFFEQADAVLELPAVHQGPQVFHAAGRADDVQGLVPRAKEAGTVAAVPVVVPALA